MLKVAWRNLWRRKTRTGVSIAAIALTFTTWLWGISVNDYSYLQMEEAAVQAAGGAVLVQRLGYQDETVNDVVIEQGAPLIERLRKLPQVAHASGRVLLSGLVSTAAASFAVQLSGFDPAHDVHFRDLRKYIQTGTFLAGDSKDPLVLGSKAVQDMELELGDRVVVTATGKDGEMRRALFHLSGVIHTGSGLMDEGLAFTTVEAAQRAFDLGGALHQIGLLPNEGQSRYGLSELVRGATEGQQLEVLTWDEAMPDLVGLIEMDKQQGVIFGLILFLVVLISIMNTFMMVVMERVREFGLLSAIGLTPLNVAKVLLFETTLLAASAISIGLLCGLLIHAYVSRVGIDLSSLYGDSIEVSGIALTDMVMYSTIDPVRWFNATLAVFLMVLLSAAYPAYKAARLTPAEAMRFYE